MKQELQNKLIKRFPFLKKKPQRADGWNEPYDLFGIEFSDGWYDLIYELFEKLEKENDNIVVCQLKEKFGMLRAYIGNVNKKSYDLIHEAENKSSKICEQCGKEGKLRNDKGWFRTECDKCREKRFKKGGIAT